MSAVSSLARRPATISRPVRSSTGFADRSVSSPVVRPADGPPVSGADGVRALSKGLRFLSVVFLLPTFLRCGLLQLDVVEQVHGVAAAPLGHLGHGGLETVPQIEDEVGVFQSVHLARRQLQVVGLDAGRGEILHPDPLPAHPLGHLLHRVEAGHHGHSVSATAGRSGPLVTAAPDQDECRHDEEYDAAGESPQPTPCVSGPGVRGVTPRP
jgi:hypothetical protein